MTRFATIATLLAVALTAVSAEAGKKRGISFGGVKIGGGGSSVQIGDAVRISLPGHGSPGHGSPGLGRPIVTPKPPVKLPHPPIVIHPPKPPVVCPPKRPIHPPVHPPIHPPIVIKPPKPPVVCPTPPIVIRPKPPIVIAPKPPIVCPTPPVVHPPQPPVVCPPPVVVEKPVCPPTYAWYFGMGVERVQSAFGVGLQITSIAPGGPAELAGLNVGDVLLVAGSVNLSQATSNTHGVELVQSAVTPEGTIVMTIVDSTTGQLGNLAMAAQAQGAAPAPTVAAPIALNPAQPTSTM